MPHDKRKVRKMRGSRTHGYGQVGQHRSGGQQGGKGKAGLSKHKWSLTIKLLQSTNAWPPGKHGFNRPMKSTIKTINVGMLDEQIEKMLTNKQVIKTKKGITINLTKLGYDKLLGVGKVTHPLIVTVDSSSKSAARKIVEARGQVLNK